MIQVVYSTEHWIVPIITMGVLVVLLAAIILTEGRARVQEGKPFFQKPGRFFLENYDKMKLWGTLLLFSDLLIGPPSGPLMPLRRLPGLRSGIRTRQFFHGTARYRSS